MLKRAVLFLMGTLYSVAYSQSNTGLVARYSFNKGNLNDEVGLNNAESVGIKLTEDRFGNEQNAVYLHGNPESYLNLGSSQILKPAEGSISVWIKLENFIFAGKGYDANPIILTKCHAGNSFYEGYSVVLGTITKKISATASLCTPTDTIQATANSSNNLVPGKWYHLVMCYNDKAILLYIDGVLQSEVRKNFRTTFLSGDSVMIGNSANIQNKRFFNGCIDDLAIYNKVLSPAEVLDLYTDRDPNKIHQLINWAGRIGLAFFLLTIFIWFSIKRYRKELKKEKENNKMQKQMYEMEMQIMKAQMNPHFIFNAMNSVQQFILAGDNQNAHKYLGKFSQLLRKMLENTPDEFISLKDEIEMLSQYIEIESLRFERAFKYEIITDAKSLNGQVKIPQMLVQPVVENAIWHGLLPKKGEKTLVIKFEVLSNKSMLCIVDDNGVGRNSEKTEDPVTKRKSLALGFISHRLRLMQKGKDENYSILITDKKNADGSRAGTRVEIVIPIVN